MEKWRILYRPWNPFIRIVTSKNNVSDFIGVFPEFFDSMKEKTSFDYEMLLQEDFLMGLKLENGSWNGMIKSMLANNYDIAGPMFITEERSQVVAFSAPISLLELSVLSGLETAKEGPFVLLSIFSWPIWVAVFTFLVFVSIAAYTMYEVLPSENKKTKLKVFFQYIWVFQASLIGKGFESDRSWHLRHVASFISFRILQGVWCIVGCVTIMNLYQGTITSTFSADKLRPKVTSLDDLIKDHSSLEVSTFGPSLAEVCLSNLQGTKYASIWDRAKTRLVPTLAPNEIPEWMEAIESGKRVFFSELGWIQLALSQRFLKTGKCGIVATPISLCSNHMYIFLAIRKEFQSSQFLEDLNRRMHHFWEADLQHLHKTKASLYYKLCQAESEQLVDPLKMDDVFGAFLIYVIGLATSVLGLVLEVTVSRILRLRKKRSLEKKMSDSQFKTTKGKKKKNRVHKN